jgi:hypothetical protein
MMVKIIGLAFILVVMGVAAAFVPNQPVETPVEECVWIHPSPTSSECVTISTLQKRQEEIAQELFRRHPEAFWRLSHGG